METVKQVILISNNSQMLEDRDLLLDLQSLDTSFFI